MKVTCPGCNGTGLCQTLQAGMPPQYPHSCCGDCNRVVVPASSVPPDFDGGWRLPGSDTVLIGSGFLEVSFWKWLGVKLGLVKL